MSDWTLRRRFVMLIARILHVRLYSHWSEVPDEEIPWDKE
jgi:hypothetical protein